MFKRVSSATIAAVLILLTISASVGIAGKHKSPKDKSKDKSIPAGRAVLWRAPADIRHRDLFLGSGGDSMKPDLRQVTLIEKEKGGYSTKYRVRDAAGVEWSAKVGKEAPSETAASRLVWGI